MENDQDQFFISERPQSGCAWVLKEFAEIRSPRVKETHSFLIPEVLLLMFKSLKAELGWSRALLLLLYAATLGFIFHKPTWHPEYFDLTGKPQEDFYKKIFKKATFYFVLFNILRKERGEEEADRMVSKIINPATLAYMTRTYKPVENCTTVEPWWKQSVDYIADLPEDNLGLDGTVYMAEDLSELKWHTIRCATAEVFRAYGLKRTMSCLCMNDHITYHTFFPGLMFKRTHCIGVGDAFCDHHAWVKRPEDAGNEEIQYGDCHHFEGGREYVRHWEAFAKAYLFGSEQEWERYAQRNMAH
jgi:hypothetical protein